MCSAIGGSVKEESMLDQNRTFQITIYSGIEDVNGWRQNVISAESSMSNAQREANNCGQI